MQDTDVSIQNLIKIVVIDADRKDKYLKALPLMSGEEKLEFALDLYQMLMVKMQYRFRERVDEMIEEMSEKQEDLYTPEDFRRVREEIINEFLEKKAGANDKGKLAEYRDGLEKIGEEYEKQRGTGENPNEEEQLVQSRQD